jgi:cell division protein FtsB
MSDGVQPYVGPRPFGTKERELFFGRDRESDDLFSLVLAHPVILVYAASGAGKSSLLNAGLIPRLKEEKFQVLGSGRVVGPLPRDAGPIANAFVFHAMSMWNSELGLGISIQELAGMTLLDFLQRLDQPNSGTPRALIFDQFEEFFTQRIEIRDERRAFIDQIAASLRSISRLRIVFGMREEYLVQLEPFVYQLPDQLRTRMRIEPLRAREATDAIRKPIESLDLEFERGENDPVQAAVKELLKVHVDCGPNGNREAIGEFVDPLQLQVVCQNIWDHLPDEVKAYAAERRSLPAGTKREKKIITRMEVKIGNVDDALSRHYDSAIASAVDLSGVSEGELRRWFSHHLISNSGIRRIAPAENEYTERLPAAALEELKKQGLIRRETRGGSVWYELSHDRFIQPVQTSNRAWFERLAPAEALRRKLETRAAVVGAHLDEVELSEAEKFLQMPEAGLLGISEAAKALVSASRQRVDEDKRQNDRELNVARQLAKTRALVFWLLFGLSICAAVYLFFAQRKAKEDYAEIVKLQGDKKQLTKDNDSLQNENKIAKEQSDDLSRQEGDLTYKNDKLLQLARNIRGQIQEATTAVTSQVNQYQELARLSLLDPRARSHSLISSREGEVLLRSLGSLQNVEQLMSDGTAIAETPYR